MDLKDQAFRGLQQQSFLDKVEKQMALLQKTSDAHERSLIDLEAKREAKKILVLQLEEELKHLHHEMTRLGDHIVVQQAASEILESQRLMLKDLQGLLQGNLFRGSAEGASFFTHSLADFAHFYEVGPLMVEAAIQQSADAFSFVFQDKSFVFVKGCDGAYYLHPVSVEVFSLLQSSNTP